RHEVCGTCKTRIETNLLRIFDCKNESCQALYKKAPYITNHLSDESEKEWNQLNAYLDLLGVSRIHNPFLVRGLDYYHKTVFEFSSPLLGAQSAFCGGGQYDLSMRLGLKETTPGIGAAIGIDRLLLLLAESNSSFATVATPALHTIVPFTEAQMPLALLLQQTLQHAELRSDLFLGGVKKGIKKADKSGARYALLIGEDEQARESVSVKCMETGESTLVGHGDIVRHLQANS
ncbi:MAG: His/Gly/Thr/Pro-type tRNA ligase C-terminal domain-containing protein, partial [Candidatus Dependentiae bacterium]